MFNLTPIESEKHIHSNQKYKYNSNVKAWDFDDGVLSGLLPPPTSLGNLGDTYIENNNITYKKNENHEWIINRTCDDLIQELSHISIDQTNDGPTLRHVINDPNAYSTDIEDYFGYALDSSEGIIISGAYEEDDENGTGSGKAYLLNTAGDILFTLDNPNIHDTSINDYFGYTVAISKNFCVVGAPGEGADDLGAVHIYSPTTGLLLRTISNPDPDGEIEENNFGTHVSLDGNICVVGVPKESLTGGVAYIFNVETGNLLHTLIAPGDPDDRNAFGNSVDIHNSKCIIGSSGANSYAGKAYIFDVTTGDLLHTLDDETTIAYFRRFGLKVSIYNNRCLIGASDENTYAGEAYVFNVDTGELVHKFGSKIPTHTNFNLNKFGKSAVLNNDYCVIGASNASDDDEFAAGVVYIFNLITGDLEHTINNPKIHASTKEDYFGISLAIDNSNLIIGSNDGPDEINISTNTFTNTNTNTYTNTNVNVNSGSSSSRSTSTTTTTSTSTTTSTTSSTSTFEVIGTNDAGTVFIYSLISGNFIRDQLIQNENTTIIKSLVEANAYADVACDATSKELINVKLKGSYLLHTLDNPNVYDTSFSDYFGSTIAISGDRCIVGAYAEDANGTHSGKSYVFDMINDDIYSGTTIDYTNLAIDNLVIPEGKSLNVVQSLPTPTLAMFEKAIYVIDDTSEYVCVANVVDPASDDDCFWLQR